MACRALSSRQTARSVIAQRNGASRARAVPVSAVFRLISRPVVNRPPSSAAASSAVAPPASSSAPVPTQAPQAQDKKAPGNVIFQGVHHVALICANLERSLEFYQGVLGLDVNPDRPHHKLPYRGAWLWIGPEMIHLMELPNPDPVDSEQRPEHGGRDRHFCIGVAALDALAAKLEAAGVRYTRSMSGRPAIFFRDPDMNCLECVELEPWR